VMMLLAAALVVFHAAADHSMRTTDMTGAPWFCLARLGNWRARARARLLYKGAMLLYNGADVQVDEDGRTPLLIACENGDIRAARNLLNNGADVNRANKKGETPLYVACERGHVDAVRLLLEKGADVERAKESGFPSPGATPLYAASFNGQINAVRLLLDNGAEVDRATKNGATPLWIACHLGHVDVARLLLEKGAAVDRAYDGETPLYIACQNGLAHGRIHVVLHLLNHGADVNRANRNGQTPLWIATRNLQIDKVRLLLDKGADVDRANRYGETPLLIAREMGYASMARLLLEHGAANGKIAFNWRYPLTSLYSWAVGGRPQHEWTPQYDGYSWILHSVVMKIWESRHWLGALCLISAFLILAYEVIQSKIKDHRSAAERAVAQAARECDALAARLREADAGCAALRAELAAAAAASTEEEAARNAQIAELRTNVTTGAAQIAELERSVTNSTAQAARRGAQAARRRRQRDELAARLREADAGRDALTAELAAAAAARNAKIAELERSLSDSTPECCYCMSAQATMSFVHGETAHLAACAECAMNLAVQGHREICPICRAPFERIVRQFRV